MTMPSFRQLSRKQRLLVAAFALGVLALFAGDPYQGTVATVDAKELALVVHNEVDHVEPVELADWIIERRSDYRLIDLRTAESFTEYSIPGSESVLLTGLLELGIDRTETVVLCSEGGIHAAQAWMLMKARGYKHVYMLRGGLEGWKDEVLFPALSALPSDAERIAFAKKAEVSKFFGGSPQTGVTQGSQGGRELTIPKLAMPSAPVQPKATGKKKKEGC